MGSATAVGPTNPARTAAFGRLPCGRPAPAGPADCTKRKRHAFFLRNLRQRLSTRCSRVRAFSSSDIKRGVPEKFVSLFSPLQRGQMGARLCGTSMLNACARCSGVRFSSSIASRSAPLRARNHLIDNDVQEIARFAAPVAAVTPGPPERTTEQQVLAALPVLYRTSSLTPRSYPRAHPSNGYAQTSADRFGGTPLPWADAFEAEYGGIEYGG